MSLVESSLKSYKISSENSVLKEILQEELNMVIWEREISQEIKLYTEFLSKKDVFEINSTYSHLDSLFLKLPSKNHVGYGFFCQDIRFISELFKNILKSQNLKIQLSVVNKVQCPKFHVDFVKLRLLCTYTGHGSHYLENENVNRNELGLGVNSKVPKSSDQVKEVSKFAVSILKGEAFKNNQGKGVVHRSPLIEENQKRVILKIENF